MCGIIGCLSWSERYPGSIFSSMLSAQAHRGPDGCGLALWLELGNSPRLWRERSIGSLASKIRDATARLGMGHNWLAIQDTSTNAQMPMVSEDHRYCLVYNGEIYNFGSIREKLIKEGHRFTTKSDAEVLLKAWQTKGPGILKSLRGMFAFLLFDADEHTLWAVRDPLGIKPLYFTKLPDGIAFASEIRSFHASGLVKRSFDNAATLAFLIAGVNKPGEEMTLYDGIREIPPGRMLIAKDANTKMITYATLPELHPTLTDEDAIETIREAVIDSVRVHLISQRPVASCMSGGLDSTTIAAAIKRLFKNDSCPYKVFTLAMSSGDDQELLLATKAAKSLHIAQRVFRRPTYVSPLDVVDMVITCETPNHVIGPINQYLLLRHISNEPEDIRVVLDGQGGDELLSGYPWYSEFLLNEIKKADPDLAGKISDQYHSHEPLSSPIHESLLKIFHDADAWVKCFDDGMSSLLRMKAEEALQLSPVEYYLGNSHDWRGFRQREYLQGELQYLLRQEDRIGMRFGIECRVPYVDIPTIKATALLKPEFLLKDGFLKYPLRVLFPEIAHEVLWNTKKRGFWDVADESFPYLRKLGEKAASNSQLIRELITQMGGDISDIKKIGYYALWRLLQIAILGECATTDMGLQWFSQVDETYVISDCEVSV